MKGFPKYEVHSKSGNGPWEEAWAKPSLRGARHIAKWLKRQRPSYRLRIVKVTRKVVKG